MEIENVCRSTARSERARASERCEIQFPFRVCACAHAYYACERASARATLTTWKCTQHIIYRGNSWCVLLRPQYMTRVYAYVCECVRSMYIRNWQARELFRGELYTWIDMVLFCMLACSLSRSDLACSGNGELCFSGREYHREQ